MNEISVSYIMDKDELVDMKESISEFFIDDLHSIRDLKAHGGKK